MVPGCDSADSPPGANADARIVLARLLELGVREVDGPQILSAWIDRSDAVAVVYVDLRQPDRLYGLRRSFPPHCRDDDPGSTGEEMWMTMVEPIGGASVVWSNGVLWHGHVQGVSWLQEGHDENQCSCRRTLLPRVAILTVSSSGTRSPGRRASRPYPRSHEPFDGRPPNALGGADLRRHR